MKKTCKRRPFRKRLKGFEPSTFCMASSSSDSVHALNVPANRPVSGLRAGVTDVQLSVRNHGSFRTETGLTLIPAAAVSRDFSRWLIAASSGEYAGLVPCWGRVPRRDPEPQVVSWQSRRLVASAGLLVVVPGSG